jgi:8-oxo-dGTP diphosphatase
MICDFSCNMDHLIIFDILRLRMNIQSYRKHPKILVAVDCIIFGFDGTNLKVLVIKRGFEPEKGKWSLMGGFVNKNESTDAAAARVLYTLTGLRNIYMEQVQAFSDVKRDIADRVISVAYFALINISNYSERLQHDHEAKWFPVSRVPSLIFDHKTMVEKAKALLREKAASHPLGFELLPRRFTLTQLQALYEAIYDTPLDKRNFQKKMLSLGFLRKLAEKDKESSKKGAFYYTFDSIKYRKLDSSGLRLI